MRWIKKVLCFVFLDVIWQFPQHLAGLILWAVLRLAKKVVSVEITSDVLIRLSFDMSVSLGRIIAVKNGCNQHKVPHERGHSIQSQRWGPLYLPVIGLPSAIVNIVDELFDKGEKWYYSRYPEKQADRLGGVKRFGEGAE